MEKRRSNRVSVAVPVTCRVPARPCRVTVVDVSYGGCRVNLDSEYIPLGSTVLIDLPVAQVSGEVVWVDQRGAGIRFHRRLPSPVAVNLGVEAAPAPVAVEAAVYSEAPEAGLRHWLRRILTLAPNSLVPKNS